MVPSEQLIISRTLSVARRRKSFWESQSMFPTLFPDVKLELLDRSLQRLVLCGYSYLHMLIIRHTPTHQHSSLSNNISTLQRGYLVSLKASSRHQRTPT